MNILLVIVKNTSALDYALPILWKVRRTHPDATLSVLYCTISRKKILRKSHFYSSVLDGSAVHQYDFADFLRQPYASFASVWRSVFAASNWDVATTDIRGSVYRSFRGLAMATLKKAELLVGRAVDIDRILPSLHPDVILFDNRSETRFFGRDRFFDYLERTHKKVVLLPHAPHHTGTTAFTPFDEHGERLPNYCEYWTPFTFDTPWVHIPERRSQFYYIGYPGLDGEWLAWLKLSRQETGEESTPPITQPLKCLFIIRKFLEKGEAKPPEHDAYIFEHDEFVGYLNMLGQALRRTNIDTEVIVKPHPSNNFRSVKRAMDASGIPKWRISHESIYAHVNSIDCVVSLYSTALLIPAMAGIPVFVLHSRIQDEIHQWLPMKDLYTGLHFYLEDPEELVTLFPEVMGAARRTGQSNNVAGLDIEHLRRFYPDGALNRALERLGSRT